MEESDVETRRRKGRSRRVASKNQSAVAFGDQKQKAALGSVRAERRCVAGGR